MSAPSDLKAFTQTVLSRLDIVDLIQTKVPLKKAGSVYLGLCPFHQEKTPSFNVSRRKQLFYCFGCGIGGDLIHFLMKHEQLDFMTVLKQLAQSLNLTLPEHFTQRSTDERAEKFKPLYQILEKTTLFYQDQLMQDPKAKHARDYLKTRNIHQAMVQRFRLGFAPSGWKALIQHTAASDHPYLEQTGLVITSSGETYKKQTTYDRFRNRLIFPIRDTQGRVVALGGRTLGEDKAKYMNSPENPIFYKHQVLYGLYEAIQSRMVSEETVIVEGYTDVIALAQQGVLNAVATLGTQISQAHIGLLLKYTQTLTFCFDGDEAGRKAAWRALELCLPKIHDNLMIQFMFLPKDDDPDSFVQRVGQVGFLAEKKNSLSLSAFLIQTLLMRYPPDSAAHKANCVSAARPLLKQIPMNAFREFLIQEFAARLGLSSEKLQALCQVSGPIKSIESIESIESTEPIKVTLQQPSQNQVNQSTGSPPKSRNQPYFKHRSGRKSARDARDTRDTIPKPSFPQVNPCIQLIQYLIQVPALIETVSELPQLEIDPNLPGSFALHTVLQTIKTQPGLSKQDLENQTDVQAALTQASLMDKLIALQSPEDKQTAFLETWYYLVNQQLEKRIQILLEQAHFKPLSDEEVTELNQLIKKKQDHKEKLAHSG